MRSCRVESLRDSCSTFSMIWLTRTAFFSMMSVRCLSSSVRLGDSPSSCPAWLIAPTGLRISCAMLALSRPSAASFDCCTRAATTLVSSRNASTGPGPRSDSDTKCGRMMVPPSADTTSPAVSRRSCGCARHDSSRYSNRGDTSPSSAPRGTSRPASSRAAVSLMRRMRSCSSTTRMLSRRCCTMNWFSSLRFARSMSRCCTSASLSRSRLASGTASSVMANRLAPVSPVTRKSLPVENPDSAETTVWNSSPSAITAVASSARRGRTMAAVAPTGRTSSVARPLPTPPLAWISSVRQRPSTASGNSAIHSAPGQRLWIGCMHTSANAK